nr:EOG090X0LZH [Eurycercus lamellatus]
MALENVDSDAMYKDKYRNLKRKLKFLIYENECFSSEIRNMEKRLLMILKDRTFLLDMLTQHENGSPAFESSDDDMTDSSDSGMKMQHKTDRKKKLKTDRNTKNNNSKTSGMVSKPRRKPQNKLEKKPTTNKPDGVSTVIMEDSLPAKQPQVKTGHMTPEEVERHLESRRAQQLEFSFAPDKAPATVPTEMFSNDIEGGGNFRDFLEDMDTSPSNGDEHAALDMEHN